MACIQEQSHLPRYFHAKLGLVLCSTHRDILNYCSRWKGRRMDGWTTQKHNAPAGRGITSLHLNFLPFCQFLHNQSQLSCIRCALLLCSLVQIAIVERKKSVKMWFPRLNFISISVTFFSVMQATPSFVCVKFEWIWCPGEILTRILVGSHVVCRSSSFNQTHKLKVPISCGTYM